MAPPALRFTTFIDAPPERCFDLARSIDLHVRSTPGTDERAIAGVTSGLIGLGESVTWRARHLGVRQTMTVRITRFERPRLFVDEMEKGAFKWFRHTHVFTPRGDGTDMEDVFEFEAPLGFLGRLASRLVVQDHMRRLLAERALHIKRAAESEEWRDYLPG